jgi:sigma-B regulation protein RsbU (phosphoserine phosphatase)
MTTTFELPETKSPAETMPRSLGRIAVYAGVYFILARIGQILAIDPGNVTPIWPASGFAFCVAMRRERYWWTGIWLGNFLGNTWAFLDWSSLESLARTTATGVAIGPGDILQAHVGATLFRRWSSHGCSLRSVRDVFSFVASQTLACLASATPGVFSLCAGQIISFENYGYTWLTWYLGDGVGIITVAPLIITWHRHGVPSISRRSTLETCGIIACSFGSALLVFTDATELSLFAVPSAILLWAAVRGNQLHVAFNGMVISAIAIFGTSQEMGPFRTADINLALMSLQLYVATTLISGLAVASALDERSVTSSRLDASEQSRKASEAELELAGRIQQDLLPKVTPEIKNFDIAATCVPAVSAAGDFFDFFVGLNGRHAIVVGDVAGHGVGPALIMASVHSRIRSIKNHHQSPDDLLTEVNQGLCEDQLPTRFITAFLATLNSETRQVCWASAGQPALLIDATGTLTDLASTGLPLGVIANERYSCGDCFELASGSTLAIMTDGLHESRNKHGEFFGNVRLRNTLSQLRHLPASEIIARLVNDVQSHCNPELPKDDLTIVIVKAM